MATTELVRVPGHRFYGKLNPVLTEADFDPFVEDLGAPYDKTGGRPRIPPGVYFRMVLVGYFEGLESQSGIAWRWPKGAMNPTAEDLRRLFSTRGIESGVDIPTVARWLGHKDGPFAQASDRQHSGPAPTRRTAMATQPIILFDGDCNLCDRTVRFIVRRDPAGRCRFAALQSEAARRLLQPLGIDPKSLQSLGLWVEGGFYTQSEAALRIAGFLPGPWRLLSALRMIPRPVRDWVYGLVAHNRHRWLGRQPRCGLPPPELRDRLVD